MNGWFVFLAFYLPTFLFPSVHLLGTPIIQKENLLQKNTVFVQGISFSYHFDFLWPVDQDQIEYDYDEAPVLYFVGKIENNKIVERLAFGRFDELDDNVLRSNYTIMNITINELGHHKLLLFLDPNNLEYPLGMLGEFDVRKLNTSMHVFEVNIIPGWATLLPTFASLLIGWITGDILLGLLIGCWCGGVLLKEYEPLNGLLVALDKYILGAMVDEQHAKTLLFAAFVTGMMAIIQKGGGFAGLSKLLSNRVSSRRGVVWWTIGLGCLTIVDDYTTALILGNTVRTFGDHVGMSREKLSYIVDTASSPLKSMIPISILFGFEINLMRQVFSHLRQEFPDYPIMSDTNLYMFLVRIAQYRFYPIFMIVFIMVSTWLDRDFGGMLKAERRAITEGKLSGDNSDIPNWIGEVRFLENFSKVEEEKIHWVNAVIPVMITTFLMVFGTIITGYEECIKLGIPATFTSIMSLSDIFSSLVWGSFAGSLFTMFLFRHQRILTYTESFDIWMVGVKGMIQPLLVLLLSWGLGGICKDLYTDEYLTSLALQYEVSPRYLPSFVFILTSVASFCTGTSWGTASIFLPLFAPLSYDLSKGDVHLLMITSAAVLTGSIFGDHCSPISDTTILASLASGCDIRDHVHTQLLYGIVVAFCSVVFGFLPVGLGIGPSWIWILMYFVFITAFIRIVGRSPLHS